MIFGGGFEIGTHFLRLLKVSWKNRSDRFPLCFFCSTSHGKSLEMVDEIWGAVAT